MCILRDDKTLKDSHIELQKVQNKRGALVLEQVRRLTAWARCILRQSSYLVSSKVILSGTRQALLTIALNVFCAKVVTWLVPKLFQGGTRQALLNIASDAFCAKVVTGLIPRWNTSGALEHRFRCILRQSSYCLVPKLFQVEHARRSRALPQFQFTPRRR